ncbi:protein of unknown function [Verrucomicrobium sp. GAS474]|uniref:DUF4886 domain-containing protein n=1 Tax=Verrucomicrobium sp. GAS474 TaxID=1882831 RepID=UPI00087C9B68|nr:DUF4886 domain-containing protein [Verrucomicrobium sp. GAS474]SDU02834.1 protein of unknown function [Verrucomicrobium sp. GAS474]
MKRLHLAVLFLFLVRIECPAQETGSAPETLKILTLGNSFAWNATEYLPRLAEAAGKRVVVFPANLSNCSLEEHASYLRAYKADPNDPKGRPYTNFNSPGREKMSLPEALRSDAWDVVTLQQASALSFKPESYEPYASELIAAIHKDAPRARIVVFETWAYREDFPGFAGSGFTQQAMFEGLASAYHDLAARNKLPLIPVGSAFQKARHDPHWTFVFPDPAFDYKNPVEDSLPAQPGTINVGWSWERDGTKKVFRLDPKHCNTAGKYLAGATFFETLFGEDVRANTFAPSELPPEDGARLRELAHEAVTEEAKQGRLAEATP